MPNSQNQDDYCGDLDVAQHPVVADSISPETRHTHLLTALQNAGGFYRPRSGRPSNREYAFGPAGPVYVIAVQQYR